MRTSKFQAFSKQAGQLFGPKSSVEAAAASDAVKSGGLFGQVKNDAAETEIIFHDAIGDSWVGSDSGTIVKLIRDSKGKPINLDINSFGGLAFDGIAIYNALAMHDAPVTATITGMAYSAASIIPMAADTIKIAENGEFGIHPAWLIAIGNQYAFSDVVAMLTTLDKQLIATYAARTGQSTDKIAAWFTGSNNDGTVFSGVDAVKYGFADELLPLKQKPSKAGADNSGGTAPVTSTMADKIRAIANKQAAALREEKIAKLRSQFKK